MLLISCWRSLFFFVVMNKHLIDSNVFDTLFKIYFRMNTGCSKSQIRIKSIYVSLSPDPSPIKTMVLRPPTYCCFTEKKKNNREWSNWISSNCNDAALFQDEFHEYVELKNSRLFSASEPFLAANLIYNTIKSDLLRLGKFVDVSLNIIFVIHFAWKWS